MIIDYDELDKALKEERLEAIKYNSKNVGFFTWDKYIRKGKLFIYLYNFLVVPEYRHINLLYLRKILRERFPNAVFYWERSKYNRFTYKT